MRVSSDIFHIHESTNVACAIAVNEREFNHGIVDLTKLSMLNFILFYFIFFKLLRKMSMWNKYWNHEDAQEPIIYNRVIKIQYNLITFS